MKRKKLKESRCHRKLCSATPLFSRKNIFKNFELLGGILDRHEGTIHRRWLKKSNKTRLAIIREAWGTKMTPSHRPDFEALELEGEIKRCEGTDYRDYYLWPYINGEDLCKPRSLLLLMSTRGRSHPSELAIREHEAHRLGRSACIFADPSSRKDFEEHCMNLVSRGGDDLYGRLWNSKTHPDRCPHLPDGDYRKPYYGLLVLETQERVLSFLVQCAKLLLHDIAEDAILQSPMQPFQIPPRPDDMQTSLATIAAETSHQKPDSLDFSRIATLLAARHDAAADHLWSLRENPSYFEAQMLEYREHRREVLLDFCGRQHPSLLPGHDDGFWARVVSHEITRAYGSIEVYAELQSQAEELKDMQKEYAEALSTFSDYPERYTAALLEFRVNLKAAAGTYSLDLGLGLCASPSMRSYYRRSLKPNPVTHEHSVLQNPKLKDDPVRARFSWLVDTLFEQKAMCEMIGLTGIIDELQRLADTESTRSLLSTYIVSTVGDLSIVSECIHQLELYQPWAQKHGCLPRERQCEMKRDLIKCCEPWLAVVRAIDEKDFSLGNLGKPTRGRFTYPVAKRRTRENVELMRSAEKNLDTFWHKVDQDIESKCGGLGGGAVHRLLTQDRTLQRTPEWIEQVRESTQPALEELYIPLSRLFYYNQTCSKKAILGSSGQQSKEKIKTRGNGDQDFPTTEQSANLPPAEAQTKPHFALNARALKVFKTLFFTPSTTSVPGEVAWMDFLHAMIAVGFVPQKLYGSVWQFSPDLDKLLVERSIQFHEPHGGNSKIPYRIARRHGRRLNRAYGWDGYSFTLKEELKQ